MDSANLGQLERAKAHFYAWRMMDAYNILRRYYGRLPFQPESNHAEYIGIFVRVLAELGKLHELKFYMAELERLVTKHRSTHILYQLGIVYAFLPDPRLADAEKIFELLSRDPNAGNFRVKARLMLADCLDRRGGENGAVRALIDSIGFVEERDLSLLVEIWKAKILRDEKRPKEAEAKLVYLLGSLALPSDWYAYFSANVILVGLYLEQRRLQEAGRLIAELKGLFEGRHFRSVELQLMDLERRMREAGTLGTLRFKGSQAGGKLDYADKGVTLASGSASQKLLLLLLERGFATNSDIVADIYQRSYRGMTDDRLIYGHVHSVRRQLRRLGLPAKAVAREAGGYRLVARVEKGA